MASMVQLFWRTCTADFVSIDVKDNPVGPCEHRSSTVDARRGRQRMLLLESIHRVAALVVTVEEVADRNTDSRRDCDERSNAWGGPSAFHHRDHQWAQTGSLGDRLQREMPFLSKFAALRT